MYIVDLLLTNWAEDYKILKILQMSPDIHLFKLLIIMYTKRLVINLIILLKFKNQGVKSHTDLC